MKFSLFLKYHPLFLSFFSTCKQGGKKRNFPLSPKLRNGRKRIISDSVIFSFLLLNSLFSPKFPNIASLCFTSSARLVRIFVLLGIRNWFFTY